jgi:hypothetical protein
MVLHGDDEHRLHLPQYLGGVGGIDGASGTINGNQK